MNFNKATNHQLWVIVNHEYDCSPDLFRGVVQEMLNRSLFDSIVMDCIKRTFKDIHNIWRVYKLDIDDLMQVGRLSIYKALNTFKSKSASFTTYIYLKITGGISRELQKVKAQKRNPKYAVSYNELVDEKNEFIDFLPSTMNVEKYVLNKLDAEKRLRILNDYQKRVVTLRLKGYKFGEISEILGRGTEKTLSNLYNVSIKKLRERVS